MRLRAPPFLRPPALWALAALVVLFVVEFGLFDRFGARRYTNLYPRWNDQIQYLSESYTGYEYARTHGLPAGLGRALTNPSAQGTLHDFLAILAFTLAGPSRSAALALNLLALLAWQAALFAAVLRRAGPPWLAFAAALLPALLAGPWRDVPGSAYDFRLDHLALCALGVTAAAAWLADGFRSRRGSLCFGVAVGLTLLTRFLTGTYFVGIFAGALAWILSGADRAARAANLGRAALLAFLLAAPVFWLNREAVREYYWIGHYIGPESAIRDPHLGFGSSLAFVLGHLVSRHLGLFWLAVAGLVAAGLALARRGAPRPFDPAPGLIGALFLGAPAAVLILHKQKSEVVTGALAPGAVMLVVALWLLAARRADGRALGITAGLTALVTGLFLVHSQVPAVHPPALVAEVRQVNALADEIYSRARRSGKNELRVAVDYITDALDAQVLRVICYERHRVWLAVNMTLPTGIAEPDAATVMSRLAESDFVFATISAPAEPFPFDRKLAALRPQVRAWCDAHLRPVNQFTLLGRRMILYQRPELPFP